MGKSSHWHHPRRFGGEDHNLSIRTPTYLSLVRPFSRRHSASITTSNNKEPFYGSPRPEPSYYSGSKDGSNNNKSLLHSLANTAVPLALEGAASALDCLHQLQHQQQQHGQSSTNTSNTTNQSRAVLTLQQAAIALRDPTRADAVAAVGELTGVVALQKLRTMLRAEAPWLLAERPIVSKATIPYEQLLRQARATRHVPQADLTLGQAYGRFLETHGFDPDERDPIRYLGNTDNDDDDELAYIMLRYRQSHDFYHALTGLPPTVLGELALKYLELYQTGLPSAALAGVLGGWTNLTWEQQQLLYGTYAPWAQRVGKDQLRFGALLTLHYETEWDTPLQDLYQRLGSRELMAPVMMEDES